MQNTFFLPLATIAAYLDWLAQNPSLTTFFISLIFLVLGYLLRPWLFRWTKGQRTLPQQEQPAELPPAAVKVVRYTRVEPRRPASQEAASTTEALDEAQDTVTTEIPLQRKAVVAPVVAEPAVEAATPEVVPEKQKKGKAQKKEKKAQEKAALWPKKKRQ